MHIVEWREIAKREFVTSFAYVLRTRDQRYPVPEGQPGADAPARTPKASTIHALAQALQADTMAKQGIDHLFV